MRLREPMTDAISLAIPVQQVHGSSFEIPPPSTPSASRAKTAKPAGSLSVRRGIGAPFLLDPRALPADRRADDHHSMAGREGFDFACRYALRLEEKLLKTSRYKHPKDPNVGFGQICPGMRHALGGGKGRAGGRVELPVTADKRHRAF